jgi:hypothetical protein
MSLLDGKNKKHDLKVLAGDPDREGGRRTSQCHISRQEFLEHAQSIDVTIGGQNFTAKSREFTTGSFGYYVNRKLPILINGELVYFQMQCQLVAVNSKHKNKKRKRRPAAADRPSGTLVLEKDPELAKRLKRAKQTTIQSMFNKS